MSGISDALEEMADFRAIGVNGIPEVLVQSVGAEFSAAALVGIGRFVDGRGVLPMRTPDTVG
ncbi:hypothetical protein [Nocardia stercoris]|uniref:hypothetical protein n=1 Tax=Nocardia stercoris TaxID=2483361 RepID=UPI0011C391A0|nr:hypothetical protein [Nocardia stercoris]